MSVTKSARLLLERLGIREAFRGPTSTVSPSKNPVHDSTHHVTMPVPIPDLVFNGDPPPDRGLTVEPWPHGEVSEE
jgi:hypothetical protein